MKVILLAVVIAAVLGVAALASVGCGELASQSNAEQALTNLGFTRVHLRTRHVFAVEIQGCGKEDVAKFDFTATNPVGRTVSVSVCEGWPFKGATVRQ